MFYFGDRTFTPAKVSAPGRRDLWFGLNNSVTPNMLPPEVQQFKKLTAKREYFERKALIKILAGIQRDRNLPEKLAENFAFTQASLQLEQSKLSGNTWIALLDRIDRQDAEACLDAILEINDRYMQTVATLMMQQRLLYHVETAIAYDGGSMLFVDPTWWIHSIKQAPLKGWLHFIDPAIAPLETVRVIPERKAIEVIPSVCAIAATTPLFFGTADNLAIGYKQWTAEHTQKYISVDDDEGRSQQEQIVDLYRSETRSQKDDGDDKDKDKEDGDDKDKDKEDENKSLGEDLPIKPSSLIDTVTPPSGIGIESIASYSFSDVETSDLFNGEVLETVPSS